MLLAGSELAALMSFLGADLEVILRACGLNTRGEGLIEAMVHAETGDKGWGRGGTRGGEGRETPRKSSGGYVVNMRLTWHSWGGRQAGMGPVPGAPAAWGWWGGSLHWGCGAYEARQYPGPHSADPPQAARE